MFVDTVFTQEMVGMHWIFCLELQMHSISAISVCDTFRPFIAAVNRKVELLRRTRSAP